jgi:hypothetical protein
MAAACRRTGAKAIGGVAWLTGGDPRRRDARRIGAKSPIKIGKYQTEIC